MIYFRWCLFATAVMLSNIVPHAAIAADCSERISYEDNISLAERTIEAKDLRGARDCLRIACDQRDQSQRQSAQYWYVKATLELAEDGGKLSDHSETCLREAADVAGPLEGGWYRIKLSKLLLKDPLRLNDAFRQLIKVNPVLARLDIADYYLLKKDAEIDWERVIGHLEELEQYFQNTGERDNVRMVLGLRAAVRAFQIDEANLGNTKDSLKDAISTIRKCMGEDPQHPLANYTLGFLLKWLSQNSPVDVSLIQANFSSYQLETAATSFMKAQPTIVIILNNKPDNKTSKSVNEMMDTIVEHLQLRLAKLKLMDVKKPVVQFPKGTPYSNTGTIVGTSEPRVWIPLDVTDDVSLQTLEFALAWGTDLDIPKKNYTIEELKGNQFRGLIKLVLPPECDNDKPCRLTITAKDYHDRSSDALQLEVRVTRSSLGAGAVYIAGIEEYEDSIKFPRLTGVRANDVRPLEDYFRVKRRANVITVPNDDITGNKLDDIFKEMAKAEGYGYALFFFSGHGKREGNDLCVITHEGHCKTLGSLVPHLRQARPTYLGVIVDACNVQFNQADLISTLWSPDTMWNTQRMFISAASKEQKAKMQNNASVFLNAFLSVIRSQDVMYDADINEDGYVTLEEVYKKTVRIMREQFSDQDPSSVGKADKFIIAEVPDDMVVKHQLSKITKNTRCNFVEETAEWREKMNSNNRCPFDDTEKEQLQKALGENNHPAVAAIKDLLIDYARLQSKIAPDAGRTDQPIKERIIQLLTFFVKMNQRPIIVGFGG